MSNTANPPPQQPQPSSSDYSNFIFALKELGYEESYNNFYKKKEFDKNFPLTLPKWDIIFNTNLFDIKFDIGLEGEKLKNLCTAEVRGTVVKMLNQDSNKPVFVLRMPKGELCVAKYLPQTREEERNGYCRYLEEIKNFNNNLIETRGYLVNKILTPRELPQRFIKMDYFDHDLQGLLQNHTFKFTIDQQKKVLCCVLRALGSLHASSLIHNNVCPSNILISTDGKIRLTGFSSMCSKTSAFTEYLDRTPTSTSCRAPEVLMKCKRYTEKVDIWGLGIVFIQMDLGIGVFRGRTREDQLKEVYKYLGALNEEEFEKVPESPSLSSFPHYPYLKAQPPLKRSIPGVLKTDDSHLIHFVDRALSYNPAQRPNAQNSIIILTKSTEKIKQLEVVSFPKLKNSHEIDFFPPFSLKFENLSKPASQIFQDPNENNFIYRWIVNRLDFIRKRVENFKQLNQKLKIQDSYDIRSLKNKINMWGEKIQQKYQFIKQSLQLMDSNQNKNNWEICLNGILNDFEMDPPKLLVNLDLQPFECLLVELRKINSNSELLLCQSKQFYSTLNSFLGSKDQLKLIWPPEDYDNLIGLLQGQNLNFGQQFMNLNSYCKLIKGTIESVLNERRELSNMVGYIAPHNFFNNNSKLPSSIKDFENGNPTNWVSQCLSVYKFCVVEFEMAKAIVDILLKTCNPQASNEQLGVSQQGGDKAGRRESLPQNQINISQKSIKSPSVTPRSGQIPSIPSEAAIAASKTMRTKPNANLAYSPINQIQSQTIKEDLTQFLQSALDNGELKQNFNECVKNYEEQYLTGNIKGAFRMPPLKLENLVINGNNASSNGKGFLQQQNQHQQNQQQHTKPTTASSSSSKPKQLSNLSQSAKWELFSQYLAQKVKQNELNPNQILQTQMKKDKIMHSRVTRIIDIIKKYPELCATQTSEQLESFRDKHFGHLMTADDSESENAIGGEGDDYYQTKAIRFTHTYADWRRQNQPFDHKSKNAQVLTNKPIVEFKSIPIDYDGGMGEVIKGN